VRRLGRRADERDAAETAELETVVGGGVYVAGGADGQQQQQSERRAFHRVTTPRSPPAMRAERLARMRGSAAPPGDARYFGSQTGSNFSLYWRSPWKL